MCITVANSKTVFDVERVENALKELPEDHQPLQAMYRKMLAKGGERFSVKPASLPAVDRLVEDMPNFAAVVNDVRAELALCLDSGDRLEITPILLLGNPGVGKTHFARALAELLGTGMGFIPMSQMTAGWIIGGAASQWKHAKPGKVFETLFNGAYANPVMLVDEIDKAASNGMYDPLGALYSLLEYDTAKVFIDEFVEIPIDAGDVLWIATANDARQVPEPLLNRMNVYEIADPDVEGARRIALNLYNTLRSSHAWGQQFPEEPSDEVLSKVMRFGPRPMRRVWKQAFGLAKLAGRQAIEPQDVLDVDRQGARPIGFSL